VLRLYRKRPYAVDPMASFQPRTFALVAPPPKPITYSSPHNTRAATGCDRVRGRGRKNRVRTGFHRRPGPPTAARRPERRGLPEVYTDTATGTKADRPQWNACLADLRRGDTLLIWKIDRLGRNLRDLIDIVTTLQTRGVGVRSLTNGIVDTTTARGNFVFGMFALMAEYEASLIKERTQAGLLAARARGRTGGRKPTMTPALISKVQRMYNARQFTMAEIAQSCGVTPMTIYRHITTGDNAPDS